MSDFHGRVVSSNPGHGENIFKKVEYYWVRCYLDPKQWVKDFQERDLRGAFFEQYVSLGITSKIPVFAKSFLCPHIFIREGSIIMSWGVANFPVRCVKSLGPPSRG